MSFIYGLRCACGCAKDGIRYIGQTVLPLNTRLTGHRGQSRFGTATPVYYWMRKHGEANIKIDQLEEVEREDLNAREIWWIANSTGLLNVSSGGTIGDARRGTKRPDISALMTGSAHPQSSLTEGDVRQIREEYVGRRGQVSELAKRYSTAISTMSSIVRGHTWTHVPGTAPTQGKSRVRLTEKDVLEIRRRRSAGETLLRIADDYDTSASNILSICSRKSWANVK